MKSAVSDEFPSISFVFLVGMGSSDMGSLESLIVAGFSIISASLSSFIFAKLVFVWEPLKAAVDATKLKKTSVPHQGYAKG